MIGLLSPKDLNDALMKAQKTESYTSEVNKIKLQENKIGSFEDILLQEMDLLRPDRSIMKAIDSNRDEEEKLRTGRKNSAFSDLIAAKVASALKPLFSNKSNYNMKLYSEDPFSPATVIGSRIPNLRIDKEEVKIKDDFGIDSLLQMFV